MKITGVGGYEAVGRNMSAVTVNDETVVIDNGIRLDTMQIYDRVSHELEKIPKNKLLQMQVIPDYDKIKNSHNIRAQVISHGHLDHVGAIPITKPNCPIIGLPYALRIAEKEYKDGEYHAATYREPVHISRNFDVEFVEVTHSIPQSSIVVLHTAEGDVVYANDFRFDNHSSIARTDYERLREIGKGYVKALIVESVRVNEAGKSFSEEVVKYKLRDVIESIDGGLICATTFSTHIERVQEIVNAVEKTGRKIIVLGRSLKYQIELASEFGLLDFPPSADIFINPKAIDNALGAIKEDRDNVFLLVTGHQGEKDAVLTRMASENNFSFRFKKGDNVLFCASTIPSLPNEVNRFFVETKLQSMGVKIFKDIHISGHATKEDHRKLLNLVRPEHIIPAHGSINMRANYVGLGGEEGYTLNKDIHLINNLSSIEI